MVWLTPLAKWVYLSGLWVGRTWPSLFGLFILNTWFCRTHNSVQRVESGSNAWQLCRLHYTTHRFVWFYLPWTGWAPGQHRTCEGHWWICGSYCNGLEHFLVGVYGHINACVLSVTSGMGSAGCRLSERHLGGFGLSCLGQNSGPTAVTGWGGRVGGLCGYPYQSGSVWWDNLGHCRSVMCWVAPTVPIDSSRGWYLCDTECSLSTGGVLDCH